MLAPHGFSISLPLFLIIPNSRIIPISQPEARMANLWIKIKVWTKITLFSALALYVLLFLYHNVDNRVKVWLFFSNELERSTLWLAMTAFVAGAVTMFITRTLLVSMRQMREMHQQKQQQQMQKSIADMHSKAAMLQTKSAADAKSASTQTPEN